MRKKRSGVWRHFEEAGQTKVSCRLCRMQLTKHGNTSMMLRHLRRRHPELMDGLFDTEGLTETGEGVSWEAEEQQSAEEGQAFRGPGKKKRSSVWRYFRQEETDKVRCRVCLEELATHYGNTTSMHRHLRGKHPQLKLGKRLEDSPKMMNHLHIRSGNTETRFLSICERFLQNSQLTDCTLVAEGQFVQVHRLVLATCSESFEEMFKTVTHANPVIILHDITIEELRGLISYMYKGKILVKSKDLPGLLKAASQLKIKGLSEVGMTESWLEDLCPSAVSRRKPVVTTTKASKAFYTEDQDMDDVTNNYPDDHVEQSSEGQKKTYGTAMVPCKKVGPENVSSGNLGATVDGSITMKRMQIKLELGTGVNDSQVQTSYEIPSPMDDHMHQQPEHQTNAKFISMVEEKEEVIHKELVLMPGQSFDKTTIGTDVGHDDDDCRAQKIKDTHISKDSGEQNTLFSITAMAMGSGETQSAFSSAQSTLDGGGTISSGGESQIPVSCAGSSQSMAAASPQSFQPAPPTHPRTYSKCDLLAAVNLVRDGHLGFKAAARAFNIPQTTLFRASKKPDIFNTTKQVKEKHTSPAVKKKLSK